jgi:hypothetical protein
MDKMVYYCVSFHRIHNSNMGEILDWGNEGKYYFCNKDNTRSNTFISRRANYLGFITPNNSLI